MAYQKVKHMTGVFASVFAHTGRWTPLFGQPDGWDKL
jgi:hypothetical protein